MGDNGPLVPSNIRHCLYGHASYHNTNALKILFIDQGRMHQTIKFKEMYEFIIDKVRN